MQVPQTGKQNQHDSLCEELLRERAAVLSRAGFAVEDALEKLLKIDQQIEEKMQYLRSRFKKMDPVGKTCMISNRFLKKLM